MWTHNTTIKSSYTRTEDNSPPPSFLHSWKTELCHEESRAAIRTPRILEIIDADFRDGFNATFDCQTRIIEENGWISHCFDD